MNSLSPEYTHATRNRGHNNSILEMISEIDSTTLNNDKESPAALKIYQEKRVERLNTEPDPDPEVLSYAPLKASKYDQYQEAFEERLQRLNNNLERNYKEKRPPVPSTFKKLNSAPDNRL